MVAAMDCLSAACPTDCPWREDSSSVTVMKSEERHGIPVPAFLHNAWRGEESSVMIQKTAGMLWLAFFTRSTHEPTAVHPSQEKQTLVRKRQGFAFIL